MVATAGGGGHHRWVDRIELARIVEEAVASSGVPDRSMSTGGCS